MQDFVDMHVHSTLSHDGKNTPEELYRRAGEMGLAGLALTEHCDFRPQDEHSGFFSYRHYDQALKELRDLEGDNPLVLRGLEFSEPHIYREEFSRISELDFDMITGAVHWIEGVFVGRAEIIDKLGREELFRRYFDKVLAMVDHGGFDVLSHLEFPCRYHGSRGYSGGAIVGDILKRIVEQDIVLEINTAAEGKPVREDFFPLPETLAEYARLGGERVIVGSDAHSQDEMARAFSDVYDLLQELDLQPGFFWQREFRKIEEMEGIINYE